MLTAPLVSLTCQHRASLVRPSKPLGHRNGTVEIATAEFTGKRAVYRIEAAPEK